MMSPDEPYPSCMFSGEQRSSTYERIQFTEVQRNLLESVFRSRNFVSNPEAAYLAQKIGVSTKRIRTWFQNKRAKLRQRSRKTSGHVWKLQLPPNFPFPRRERKTDEETVTKPISTACTDITRIGISSASAQNHAAPETRTSLNYQYQYTHLNNNSHVDYQSRPSDLSAKDSGFESQNKFNYSPNTSHYFYQPQTSREREPSYYSPPSMNNVHDASNQLLSVPYSASTQNNFILSAEPKANNSHITNPSSYSWDGITNEHWKSHSVPQQTKTWNPESWYSQKENIADYANFNYYDSNNYAEEWSPMSTWSPCSYSSLTSRDSMEQTSVSESSGRSSVDTVESFISDMMRTA